jgi:NAD(P)-dependent dehydrogenase (short-subunit alcohol dehydrogenase family)
MSTVLITGSNRGLGLEWVRQYVSGGWRVFASCRHPVQADALQLLAKEHDKLSVHQLDVTDPKQIQKIVNDLQGAPIDLLINNAGVYFERWGKDKLGSIDYTDWLETFNVNSLGAMRLTEAFRQNIAKSEKRLVVTITSHMGSIEDIKSSNDYAYRSSKAALNAAMKGLVYELAPLRIGILLLHPGWVRTRMGGSEGRISVTESVNGMRTLVDRFKQKDSGRFFRYDGSIMPW